MRAQKLWLLAVGHHYRVPGTCLVGPSFVGTYYVGQSCVSAFFVPSRVSESCQRIVSFCCVNPVSASKQLFPFSFLLFFSCMIIIYLPDSYTFLSFSQDKQEHNKPLTNNFSFRNFLTTKTTLVGVCLLLCWRTSQNVFTPGASMLHKITRGVVCLLIAYCEYLHIYFCLHVGFVVYWAWPSLVVNCACIRRGDLDMCRASKPNCGMSVSA